MSVISRIFVRKCLKMAHFGPQFSKFPGGKTPQTSIILQKKHKKNRHAYHFLNAHFRTVHEYEIRYENVRPYKHFRLRFEGSVICPSEKLATLHGDPHPEPGTYYILLWSSYTLYTSIVTGRLPRRPRLKTRSSAPVTAISGGTSLKSKCNIRFRS